MKYITIVILLTTNVFAADINNGVKTNYYKNGNIKSTVTYKNSKKEGLVLKYDNEGFLRNKSWYKNDLVQKSRLYKTYEECLALDYGGLGLYLFKDKFYNACLSRTIVYDRDKGIYISRGYYRHGVVRVETMNEINTSKSIETKKYYETGVLNTIENRGKKIDLEYYPNGQIASDWTKGVTYPPTLEEFSKVTELYMSSLLREPITKEERKKLIGTPYKSIEGNYDLRKYVGGNIQKIVPYRNGKKEGLAVHIFYNDVWFLKTTFYKNGKKDGYETLYKKEGWLLDRKIGTLLNDDSKSKSIYDDSDVLVSKVLYKKGKKVNE